VKKLTGIIKNAVGLREILLISGFVALAYGLYLLRPWLSFSVSGCLLIVGGFFYEERK
jgi:hypothetical protein